MPKSMLIVGAGPIGLLNALYARQQGCAQIYLADTSRARLDWAVKRGIVASDEAVLNSPQLVELVLERTAGQGVDVAYLCTPRSATRSALKQALHVVREDGGISLTAAIDSPEELPELPKVDLVGIRQANVCGLGHTVQACVIQSGKRLWLTGHSGASASYLQQAMQRVHTDPTLYAQVISHLVSYHAAPRVFESLLAATPQHDIAGAPKVKVIIDFTNEGEEIEAFEPRQWFSQNTEHTQEETATTHRLLQASRRCLQLQQTRARTVSCRYRSSGDHSTGNRITSSANRLIGKERGAGWRFAG